eukprot:6192806-Pleurochrysis_carterae.AAC.2
MERGLESDASDDARTPVGGVRQCMRRCTRKLLLVRRRSVDGASTSSAIGYSQRARESMTLLDCHHDSTMAIRRLQWAATTGANGRFATSLPSRLHRRPGRGS